MTSSLRFKLMSSSSNAHGDTPNHMNISAPYLMTCEIPKLCLFSIFDSQGRYTVNDNQTQSWREWAGQKIKLRWGQTEEEAFVQEKLNGRWGGMIIRRGVTMVCLDSCILVTVWRTKYLLDAFGINVFVSGFGANHHPPEQASRSQRAFIHLTKGTIH